MSAQPNYDQLHQQVEDLNRELACCRATEQHLRSELSKLENIFQKTADGIYATDQNGLIVRANQAFCHIMGCDEEQLRGRPNTDLIQVDYEAGLEMHSIDKGSSSDACCDFIESSWKRKDSKVFDLETHVTNLHSADGNFCGLVGVVRDVSGRHRAGRQLQETSRQLEMLIENSLDPIIIGDGDGTIVKPNRAFLQMIGFSEGDVVGKPAHVFTVHEKGIYETTAGENVNITDAYVEQLYSSIPRFLEEAHMSNWEMYYLNRDGKAIPATQNIVILNNAKDERIASICIIRDITEQKKAELELRQSEERFRTIFEFAPDGYYLCDFQGTFLDGNKAAENIIGYSRNELIGKNFFELDLLLPEQFEKAAESIEKNIQGLSTGPDEFILKRKDNSLIPVEISTLPVDLDGQNIILGLARDITERRNAEDELRASEERFRALALSAPEAIVAFDSRGAIIFWNRGATNIFGYCDDEIIGQSASVLINESDRMHEMDEFENVKNRQKQFFQNRHFQGFAQRKDGSIFANEISIGTWETEQGRFFIAIIRDITQRKVMEEKLQQAHDLLEIKVKERTENLEEANTALKVLLKHRDEDKAALEEKMVFNVKELVMPYLEKLKHSRLTTRQNAFLEIMENNLNDVISPFLRGLSLQHLKLTPTEIQVANLIKQGKTTKDIAAMLNLGAKTIEFHRENIRKKLGITNKKVNLRTFLLSVE
ncbi:helix-turn-helix transcriptional regulator [Thermodesulfobacteriota bacterium]